MPKLWNTTIESHRRDVRDAILDTTARLVRSHGLLSVTMSEIAEQAGIGRATLYKYFSDVESILRAWHEREIAGHLAELADARDRAIDPASRLEAVLQAYAQITQESRGHYDSELGALMHRDDQVARAEQKLRRIVRDLVIAAQRAGTVREDASPDELTSYCLHAVTAAAGMRTKAAVRRLVEVVLDGLRTASDPTERRNS